MDDAYEALKSKKAKDESFSDTIRKVCSTKKIEWDQWFGILKGGEARAKEMQKATKKLRIKTSQDINKRIQGVKKHDATA